MKKKTAPGPLILKEISDNVSSKVREQYEEGPYPDGSKLLFQSSQFQLSNYANRFSLKISYLAESQILIAGCGTGQHSIDTAKDLKQPCHSN